MKELATTRQQTPNGDAIIEKIKELEDEKQKAWLKIRSKDQVLAAQLQPAPLSFDRMQALIPDAETANAGRRAAALPAGGCCFTETDLRSAAPAGLYDQRRTAVFAKR